MAIFGHSHQPVLERPPFGNVGQLYDAGVTGSFASGNMHHALQCLTSRRATCCLGVMAIWLLFPPTAGAQLSAENLAPFLDDATVAVVEVDLADLHQDSLRTLIGSAHATRPVSVEWSTMILERTTAVIDKLQELGVSHLYAVYSLHDVTRPLPYLVVPTPDAAQAEQVAGYLRGLSGNGTDYGRLFAFTATLGDVVVCGNAGLLDRLEPGSVPARGDRLNEAWAAHEGAPLRLVCVLTPDQRRVLSEMLAKLPSVWGGFSGSELANAVQWLSVGFDPQQRTMSVRINAGSDDSATKLAAGLPQLISGMAIFDPAIGPVETPEPQFMASPIVQQGGNVTFSLTLPEERASNLAAPFTLFFGRLASGALEGDVIRNLKQIGLGLHNFNDDYRSFPPPASFDEEGKPLLSWRVYLLPYLGHRALYEEFHLNERWDSPHNRQLIKRMPSVYASQHVDLNAAGKTQFQFPVGEATPFHGKTGTRISEITDGTSSTIMVLQVPRSAAVPWTQPADLELEWNQLKETVFGEDEFTWTVFCDGSARRLPAEIPAETLKAVLTHRGGEIVSWDF